ncbi:beta-galactosidase [Desertibaculum subflavum]|uniref:beta-galactosidase n=1 Tax=Desertibaculum subflavum TaxID=2268458 RepID=UPI000E6717D9
MSLRHFVFALLLTMLGAPVAADQLIVPQPADRGASVTAHYRLDRPIRARGHLDIEWTDQYGRQVDRRRVPVELADQIDATFTLDLRRAVALRNHLSARLTLGGRPAGSAETTFIARPAGAPFDDYQIVMWQKRTPAQWATLKRIGVTAGTVFGDREGRGLSFSLQQIEPLLDHDLRWYVENIATDYYAAYHRWTPDKPINWLFLEAQRRYAENPFDPAAFRRQPGLSDPIALRTIEQRLAATVRLHQRYAPLFYNLGDEPGIADLSAHWDFDFSPASLAAFREHLRQRYGSLAALNATWGTDFARWDAVAPRTTREAIRQSGENFAAWAEFKAWMDDTFAAAVRAGTAAVHRADPMALAAITGGQVPGWGGWNYAALAGSADVMEIGISGRAFDIARDLDPRVVMPNTSFGSGGREAHKVWRQLLRGGRGLIIWDDQDSVVATDGTLMPRGQQAAELYALLRGGVGSLIMQIRRLSDPVALLYSPASFRTRWILDRQPDGEAWSRRSAEDEHLDESDWRKSLAAYVAQLERLGLSPRFLASRNVEAGALRHGDVRLLVLPQAIALSAREAEEIRAFVDRGGTVVADTEPGIFDQLSRRVARPPLADLFAADDGQIARAGRGRAAILAPSALNPVDEESRQLDRLLTQGGLQPPFRIDAADGRPRPDIAIYRFGNDGVTLLAIQADLPPATEVDEPRSLDPRRLRLDLPRPAYLYDVREGLALGRTDRVDLALDPVDPIIVAIAESALPLPVLQAPARMRRGETATIALAPAGATTAAVHVYRVDVIDPAGVAQPHYAANLIAPRGRARLDLPIALNDPTGIWQIRVTDRLSGTRISARIEVTGP